MDSKLQLFAKVLLKEHYDEFLEMIQLFNIDKRTFGRLIRMLSFIST